MTYDYVIIGAGIVGLATAYQLKKLHLQANLVVIEKESKPGLHQTGRNSGVVHTGVYYKPGSLKATNCAIGRKELLSFCEKANISFRKMHKVILATKQEEFPKLEEIYQRGLANGIPGLCLIGPERLQEIEPHARALKALLIPECHIIDYKDVAENFASRFDVCYDTKVLKIVNLAGHPIVQTTKGDFVGKIVINCAGLYSDRLANKNRILPFRGEYYELKRTDLVKGLIYPVPDPKFPFLGVHLTPMMNGKVEAGPNAVLAMGREAYEKGNWKETLWTMQHSGFWKMALRYWKAGLYELARSKSQALFLKDLQRLVPEIKKEDLIPGNRGIRAQVVICDGKLMDDFAFEKEGNVLHVINAPSPAATASFAIGKTIADMVLL